MKIKTSELIGAALSWAVAEAKQEEIGIENGDVVLYFADSDGGNVSYEPWKNWAQGGPIFDQNLIESRIETVISGVVTWRAYLTNKDNQTFWADHPTPLIAAMRCYVASKLGDEVEIPDELHTSK